MSLSRRELLGAAGALVGGALAAGCGADEAGTAPPSDADVLAGLLRQERAAGAAVIGSPLAELVMRQDERHAARLAELAGTEVPGSDTAHHLASALARKQEAVFAYVEALPRLADPAARVAVMQILASEAGQLAALRGAAEQPPVLGAFAGFTAR